LAARYEAGDGVPKDYSKALELYQLVVKAASNFTPAHYKIGLFYSQGLGVIQDYKEALSWYSLAAKQGTSGWRSQTALGLAYVHGQGVPIDLIRAHMWFNVAALSNQDDPIKRRENIQNRMTPQQIEEAQRLAKECIASKYSNCGLGFITFTPITETIRKNNLYEDLFESECPNLQVKEEQTIILKVRCSCYSFKLKKWVMVRI
jgi:TPR repeat protein